MSKTAKIDVHDDDLLTAIGDLMRGILALEEIGAVLVPRHLSGGYWNCRIWDIASVCRSVPYRKQPPIHGCSRNI